MREKNTVNIKSAPAWTESAWPFSSMSDGLGMNNDTRPDFDTSGVTTPAVNIIETPVDMRLEMVAPGMKKEAFNISLQENVLTISYDHADNRGGERRNWKYRMREYNYHSFMRSFYLPDTVLPDQIEAAYVDGILNLRIPKKNEAISREIEVF